MQFSKNSGTYRLFNEHFLPITLEDAWNFFSNPKNLQEITPKNLDFKITNLDSETAYSGQIITYSIRLNKLIRMNWVTEITHLKEKSYFVDEQRYGPYKMWHHFHKFEAVNGGVMMTDIVHFKLPFPILSSIAYRIYVRKNLEQIFTFRTSKLNELLNNKGTL